MSGDDEELPDFDDVPTELSRKVPRQPRQLTQTQIFVDPSSQVLPFNPAPVPAAPRFGAPPPAPVEEHTTTDDGSVGAAPVMPFAPAPARPFVAAPIAPAPAPARAPAPAPPTAAPRPPTALRPEKPSPTRPPITTVNEAAKPKGTPLAAPSSVLDASNRAAGPTRVYGDAEPAPAADPIAEPRSHEVIDLLGHEAAALPRVRRWPAFRPVIDGLRDKPIDVDVEDPALDAAEAEARSVIFEVLASGDPIGADGLRAAMTTARREDGRFVAPLALLAGELALAFDEVASLELLVTAVAPLVGADERARSAVDAARERLAAGSVPPAQAAWLAGRVREAYAQGKRAVPLSSLEAQIERALVERRRYQTRGVFGSPHLRASLHVASGAPQALGDRRSARPIPAYLAASLADRLPLSARFRARVIAEAHLAIDPSDNHPAALRVVALARVGAVEQGW
jgi:hypothetical protein